MDKDQWRKILFDAIPPPAAQSCEVQEGWMAKLDKAADAIAQAHEQEVAQFRAQGAVLGEALREIEEDASGTNQPGTDWVYLKRIGILAQQALSAAPKVAARLTMLLWREPMGDRYLVSVGQESYAALGRLRYGDTYDVLVLPSEQESDNALQQGSKAEVPDGEQVAEPRQLSSDAEEMRQEE